MARPSIITRQETAIRARGFTITQQEASAAERVGGNNGPLSGGFAIPHGAWVLRQDGAFWAFTTRPREAAVRRFHALIAEELDGALYVNERD